MAAGNNGTYDYHRGRAPLLRPVPWWRTGVFMAVNLAGFAVVCAFWQYLATGQWMDFSLSAYVRDLKSPIGQAFIHGLGVLRYPWMVLVAGLLLGTTVFVPIIVAVLYRLRFVPLFLLLVAAVAHAPALALVTAVGCMLATRTQLRSDMPFVAALLGILPIAGFLYILGFMGVDTVAVVPLHRWVLYAPFVIAIVAAVLAAAVVLSLARVTGFRPGITWPVLLLMLAGPMAVFYSRVGSDELAYCLLARRLAPGDSDFEPMAVSELMADPATHGLDEHKLLIYVRTAKLVTRRGNFAKDCRKFVARYPRSRRALEVLWMQAHCLSLQVDEQAYKDGMVKYTSRYCQPQAQDAWQQLVKEYGGTSHAALGRWRLGELAMRSGNPRRAYELLEAAVAGLVEAVDAAEAAPPAKTGRIFLPRMTLPADGHYEIALFEAQRLVWLMERNEVLEDKKCAQALAKYLSAVHPPEEDPNKLEYHKKLKSLAAEYSRTALGDNLTLAAARTNPDRAAAAKTLLDLARADTDVTIEANYELGQLAIRSELRRQVPQLKAPRTYFQRVIDGTVSPWQRLAFKCLAAVGGEDATKP